MPKRYAHVDATFAFVLMWNMHIVIASLDMNYSFVYV